MQIREGTTKAIHVSETVEEVEHLLRYIYTKDYLNLTRTSVRDPTEQTCFHLQIFELGDKYMMSNLRKEALKAFWRDLDSFRFLNNPQDPEFSDAKMPKDAIVVYNVFEGYVDFSRIVKKAMNSEGGAKDWKEMRACFFGYLQRHLWNLKNYPYFWTFLEEEVPLIAVALLERMVMDTDIDDAGKTGCFDCKTGGLYNSEAVPTIMSLCDDCYQYLAPKAPIPHRGHRRYDHRDVGAENDLAGYLEQ